MKKSYAALLGLFVAIGALIGVVAIFLIGSRQGIFSRSVEIYARFNSVEGLEKGAAVRLLGIEVGSVSEIKIWNDVALVDIKVFSDSRKFIKTDSRAMLETEGLVGNKFVALTPGTGSAPSIQPLDTINSIEEPQLSEIISQTSATIASVKAMVDQFSEILKDVHKGRGTLGKLVTDESVYIALKHATYEADSSLKQVSDKFTVMANVVADLSTSFKGVVDKTDSVLSSVNLVVKNFDTTSSSIKLVASQIDTGRGLAASLIHDRSVYDTTLEVVSTTLSAVKEAQVGLQRFAEDMEAIRHNWLFSGYFSEKTADEYTKKQEQLKQLEAQINSRLEFLDETETQIRELQEKLQKSGGADSSK
jgi:phospholipid/cholesterol/gamma-HCH transport system substrate-binding protein